MTVDRVAMLERENLNLKARLLESQMALLQSTIVGAEMQLPLLQAQLKAVLAKIAESEKK